MQSGICGPVITAVIGVLALSTAHVCAQTWPEVRRDLYGRMSPQDDTALEQFREKAERKTLMPRDVVDIWARGFEYYKHRDFFTASHLFLGGLVPMEEVFPETEEHRRRARAMLGLSRFYFCRSEPEFCRIEAEVRGELMRSTTGVPSTLFSHWEQYGYLRSAKEAPLDLSREVVEACLLAHQRLQGACTQFQNLAECRRFSQPEC